MCNQACQHDDPSEGLDHEAAALQRLGYREGIGKVNCALGRLTRHRAADDPKAR